MATTFSHNVTDGNNTVTVNFTLHPIRSSNFQVLVQDGQGNFVTHMPAAASTYLGHVEGMPGALASGLVRANGNVLCRISFESGMEWSSTGVGNATVRGNTNWKPNPPNNPNAIVGSGGAGWDVFAAEVGVDATNAQYIAAGSSVDATLEMVEFSVMAANVAYLRDAAILHRVGKVVVRSSAATDPYVADGNNTTNLLNRVREQWNNVLPVGSTHQLALVVKPGANGGLAWVGVIGTASRYSANGANANGDFSVIWRHEAGHNWSSRHYEGGRAGHAPEGPTIMSDNSLSRFSSAELVKIIAHRVAKTSILENVGVYSFALPPRANMDNDTFPMDTQVTINVLKNDSDSNGQVLMLSSPLINSASALGGQLMLSTTSRGQIIYTPPAAMASGVDYFSYQIADAAGNKATGYVTLRPTLDDDLVAHWPLDEGRGTIVYDTTPSQNDGNLTSGATWKITGAISLDGANGQVIAGKLNLDTNSITITGWVRCNGTQLDWAGLAMCRDGVTSAGLNLAVSNELRYHWGAGSNPSFNFSSGLILRDATWTFVALVISPTQATIYMREEAMTQLHSAASADAIFGSQNFQGPFCLGNDQLVSNRFFKGDMANFRVFRRALTGAEITSLASDGGTPSALLPRPGSTTSFAAGRSFDFNSTLVQVEEPMICGTCEMHIAGTQESTSSCP